ncbi:MAG TPA: metallopeptidase family protein [Jiangellaceae bacterium]|nr:metallopeptidase family protein [Jiangellaceae bacterium]
MDANAMDLATFEELVSDALASMPEWVQEAVAGVAILVDDLPPQQWQGTSLLLGQFHGVARSKRGARIPGSLPDRIELYRIPILKVCNSPEDVALRVKKVLGHEIGHALGVSEVRLRELGWH